MYVKMIKKVLATMKSFTAFRHQVPSIRIIDTLAIVAISTQDTTSYTTNNVLF